MQFTRDMILQLILQLVATWMFSVWVLAFIIPGPYAVDPRGCLLLSGIALGGEMIRQGRHVQAKLMGAALLLTVAIITNHEYAFTGVWLNSVAILALTITLVCFFLGATAGKYFLKNREEPAWPEW